jgi:hypothetical protein
MVSRIPGLWVGIASAKASRALPTLLPAYTAGDRPWYRPWSICRLASAVNRSDIAHAPGVTQRSGNASDLVVSRRFSQPCRSCGGPQSTDRWSLWRTGLSRSDRTCRQAMHTFSESLVLAFKRLKWRQIDERLFGLSKVSPKFIRRAS